LIVIGLVIMTLAIGPARSVAQPSTHPFEIVPGSFHITPSTDQAGAHADWTTTFDFAHNAKKQTFNDLKDTVVNLPAGFMGNNTAVPTCTVAQLLGKVLEKGAECPPESQVGTISLDLTLAAEQVRVKFPLYNVEVTSFGVTAELGFNALVVSQVLPVTVRPGDVGITLTSRSIEGIAEPRDISATVWGVPAANSHDAERGQKCYPDPLNTTNVRCVGGGQAVTGKSKPFLANPTSCGAFTATMKADSWEETQPESWLSAPFEASLLAESTEIGPIAECERVHFDPSVTAEPTTNSVESPSGLNVSLEVPQTWENPDTIATSNLQSTTVTLPVGYTVNPSAGSGLVGCTLGQYAAESSSSPAGSGCPPESKLGKVEIETPVLAERLSGNVYLAQPFENKFNSLLAMYVIAKAPDRGIIVKTAGEIEPDPVTGQIVTTFDEIPQQPFSKVTLELKQGQTSPLASPPLCGSYTVLAQLIPSSAPTEPRFLNNSFPIERGIGGGPCPSGGAPPFYPTVIAGTQNANAGNYSPFYLRIVRNDGEQEITKFSTILPPGLTGNLSGVPFCSEAAVEAARNASGLHEIKEPSCPVTSEIGHSLVGAGVGGVLAWTPGKVYLAGPYHGAPFSLVSVTSATVGPFDLGTVVIRFALRINATTAQVEVDSTASDPIPHIIDGIVVHVRDIHVYIDRSDFTLNPTNCDPKSIFDVITGTGADPANPADQMPVSVNTRFQAADCQDLQFKPVFKASTFGKTSRTKGASLRVKLTYPRAPLGTQTNIASVKVDLPRQLPSRLTTLQKACPDSTFNADPALCPAASRVGQAKAVTPILPVPLIGPAYFVSHGGAKFPELVIVLQGYGVTIDLHGETFISKQGITSSTFRTVPDQPVTSFELTLPQGPYSALAAPGNNLCQATHTISVRKRTIARAHGHSRTVTKTVNEKRPGLAMPTAFTGQNGSVIHTSTPITVAGCAKSSKKTRFPRKH
jgi:hypothetical protein